MPAGDDAERPDRRRLLTKLFWAGVGLAPLAALMLLFGQSGGLLRFAAVLAVLSFVLIGLLITLRGDAQTVRSDLEESRLATVEQLRGALRKDISAASRATHQSFAEQLQAVQQNVEALRRQLDAVRSDEAPGQATPRGGRGDGTGRTDPVPPRTSTTTPVAVRADAPVATAAVPPSTGRADPGRVSEQRREAVRSEAYGGSERDAGRYAGAGRYAAGQRDPAHHGGDAEHGSVPYGSGPYGDGSHGSGRYGGGQYPTAGAGPGRAGDQWTGRTTVPPAGGAAPPRPHLAAGVVRHTETVKVTTRQTIVGPAGDDRAAGHGYGNVYGGAGYSPSADYPSGAGYAAEADYGSGADYRSGGGYPPGADYPPSPDYPPSTDYPSGADHPPANAYGGRGGRDGDWSEQPAGGRRAAGTDEDSRGDQWPGARSAGEARGSGRYAPVEPDDGGLDDRSRWSGRAGDRWASVRNDERGSELRVGERRAAVHADESGTELRAEDRWAIVRREEPRREEPRREESWRGESGREEAGWSGARGTDARATDAREGGGRRRAERWGGADVASRSEVSRSDGGFWSGNDQWGRGDERGRGDEGGSGDERDHVRRGPEGGWEVGGRRRAGAGAGSADVRRPGADGSEELRWPGAGGTGQGQWSGAGAGAGDVHWPGGDAGAGDVGWARGGAWPDRTPGRSGGSPALPTGAGSSGTGRPGWDGPPAASAAPGGRRRAEDQAYGYPPEDDVPRAGGARWR